MADSPVAICSNALRRIGAHPIAALTDNSDEARLCNALYTPTLRRLLRSSNWNFAMYRVALAALTDAPAFGYTHQFAIPTDPELLFLLETNLTPDEPWEIETFTSGAITQRVIVTDATAISIKYVGLTTDTTLFDSMFDYLFEADLALQLSYPITRNAQLSSVLQEELKEARQKARSRDGQEARTLKKFNSDQLTAIR